MLPLIPRSALPPRCTHCAPRFALPPRCAQTNALPPRCTHSAIGARKTLRIELLKTATTQCPDFIGFMLPLIPRSALPPRCTHCAPRFALPSRTTPGYAQTTLRDLRSHRAARTVLRDSRFDHAVLKKVRSHRAARTPPSMLAKHCANRLAEDCNNSISKLHWTHASPDSTECAPTALHALCSAICAPTTLCSNKCAPTALHALRHRCSQTLRESND
jgi:hypothetical protein